MLAKCLLEGGERPGRIAARQSKQAAAACRGGERRGAVEGASALLQPGEECLRFVRSPERDESFDLVGDEADRARLADACGEEPLALGAEETRRLLGSAQRELEDAERPDAVDPGYGHAALSGKRKCSVGIGACLGLEPERGADERAHGECERLVVLLAGLQGDLEGFVDDPRRFAPAADEILRLGKTARAPSGPIPHRPVRRSASRASRRSPTASGSSVQRANTPRLCRGV